MRDRWKIVLVAIAVASTSTLGASAGLLRPPVDDDVAATTPASAPSPAPPPASPDEKVTTEPPFAVTDVGGRPSHQAPRDLDHGDPWASSPKTFAVAPRRATKPKPRPLDTEDPWRAAPSAPASPPPPAATPARLSDDALREAIKRALDAGDLDRAAKLLDILRAAR
jgi:hypothetical protein